MTCRLARFVLWLVMVTRKLNKIGSQAATFAAVHLTGGIPAKQNFGAAGTCCAYVIYKLWCPQAIFLIEIKGTHPLPRLPQVQ